VNTCLRLTLAGALACICAATDAQSVLFDFNGGPQYSGTPLDQYSSGIRAHFWGQNEGLYSPSYSIQNIAQVIGMYPTGFTGLGLSPDSVFGADLHIAFFRMGDGSAVPLTNLSIMVAPQELSCDSSSTMQITAYRHGQLVGTRTAIAPQLDNYLWPTIDVGFSSAQTFDSVTIHFLSGPPTGGDWGGIFVADNLSIMATPEPSGMAGLGLGVLAITLLARQRRRARLR